MPGPGRRSRACTAERLRAWSRAEEKSGGCGRKSKRPMARKPHHLEVGSLDARTSTAFDDDDRRRRTELDRLIRDEGHCRYCRKRISDDTMGRTPGVCGGRECRKKARAA